MQLDRARFDYQACYCEENIVRLASRPELASLERHIIFITNESKTCAVFEQRSAPRGHPTIWDYHVVLAAVIDGARSILDFDTRLPFVTPIETYVERAFASARPLPESLWPKCRVVEADECARRFASDRTHMLDAAGNYVRPPPPWPTFRGEDPVELSAWIDLTSEAPGRIVPATMLTRAFDPEDR